MLQKLWITWKPYGAFFLPGLIFSASAAAPTMPGHYGRKTIWRTTWHRAGEFGEAETLFADAVTRRRRVFAHGEWDLGMFMLHLGEVLRPGGKDAMARPVLLESVSILQASPGAGDSRTLRAKADLAAR